MSSQVYPWPVDGITVPAIVVGYPDSMTFDLTFGRGGDSLVLPLWFVIGQGQTSTKDVRDQLSTVIGAAPSIKSTLDGDYAWGTVRVADVKIEGVTSGGISYIAALFNLDIMTPGAMDLTTIMDGVADLCTTAGL
jgi:hypothetical protein